MSNDFNLIFKDFSPSSFYQLSNYCEGNAIFAR